MAGMVLTGVGSLIGQELAKVAVENAPILKQVAQSTAVDIAKKAFDYTLSQNPKIAHFLSGFGIHPFHSRAHMHKTFANRGTHQRKISYHNHY